MCSVIYQSIRIFIGNDFLHKTEPTGKWHKAVTHLPNAVDHEAANEEEQEVHRQGCPGHVSQN